MCLLLQQESLLSSQVRSFLILLTIVLHMHLAHLWVVVCAPSASSHNVCLRCLNTMLFEWHVLRHTRLTWYYSQARSVLCFWSAAAKELLSASCRLML